MCTRNDLSHCQTPCSASCRRTWEEPPVPVSLLPWIIPFHKKHRRNEEDGSRQVHENKCPPLLQEDTGKSPGEDWEWRLLSAGALFSLSADLRVCVLTGTVSNYLDRKEAMWSNREKLARIAGKISSKWNKCAKIAKIDDEREEYSTVTLSMRG